MTTSEDEETAAEIFRPLQAHGTRVFGGFVRCAVEEPFGLSHFLEAEEVGIGEEPVPEESKVIDAPADFFRQARCRFGR